jgi:hypothetical protein
MISFTDIIEAFNMVNEAKNSGLSTLEATVLLCYVAKDLLIVSAVLGTIIWFKLKKGNK